MKAKLQQLMLVLIIPLALTNNSNYTNLCRLLAKNTSIQIPGSSCNGYIKCDGTRGKIFYCAGTDEIFDIKQEKCIRNPQYREWCTNPCADKNYTGLISNTNNCNSFYFCLKGINYVTVCQKDHHFDHFEKKCIPIRESQCIDNVNICQLLADQTTIRNEFSCTKYYKCENGKLTSKDCAKRCFNQQTGKCENGTNVKCKHCKVVKCLKNNKPFVGNISDGRTLRGYYVCTDIPNGYDLQPVFSRCSQSEFFLQRTQHCEKIPIQYKLFYYRNRLPI